MPAKRPRPIEFLHHRADGSLWARGQTLDGLATGHWEWFRRDGSRSGSGQFERGQKAGTWTTYDPKGRVRKVTTFAPKPARATKAKAKKTAGKKTVAAR